MQIESVNLSPAEAAKALRAYVESKGVQLSNYGVIYLISHDNPKVTFQFEGKQVKTSGTDFQVRENL
jgi:hypothetical protein